MVSVLHKELEYKVENSSNKKLEVMQPRIKTNPNFQLVNKPSWVSPHEVLQSWLINAVYHLLVKNNNGEGRGGLLTFFLSKRGGGKELIKEGGLIEDLRYYKRIEKTLNNIPTT